MLSVFFSLISKRVFSTFQVFYSYGLALGSIISFGSYNAPGTNCIRDVLLITACNAFTAVYACAVIFAILGFKAQHLFDKCMHQ
jgi:solute carrier family 6 amino acid/orphan transporter-like 15/16/17/18/20